MISQTIEKIVMDVAYPGGEFSSIQVYGIRNIYALWFRLLDIVMTIMYSKLLTRNM